MKRLDATLYLSKLLSPTYTDAKELKKIIQSDSSVWEAIIMVANRYILVSALYATLKRKKLLMWLEDKQLLAYMEEIYNLNTKRNEAILFQLKEICMILGTIGVKPTLLKGSAALSEAHYHTIGERFMMDIDIFVPEEKLFKCIALLKAKDNYKEINENKKLSVNWHHYHRLYKDSGMASVEIHRYPLHYEERKYFSQELIKKHINQSTSIENASVIEPMYELYHSFLHSQISHKYHHDKFLALRHMHHFTIMANQYKDIQWENLSALVKENNLQNIWEEYLFIIQHIFKIEIPTHININKSKEKYLQKVYKRIDMTGSTELLVKVFIKRFFRTLSYDNLRNHYNFKNKILLIFYIPKKIISLIFSYIKDSKKINSLFNALRISAN